MRALRTIVLLVVVAFAGFVAATVWFNVPGPRAASGDETIVLIERGTGLFEIAQELEDAGLVPSARFFAIYLRLTGQSASLKAGEYAVPTRSSMAEIAALLRQGKSILHKITLPEGITTAQALKLVVENDVLTGELTETPAEGDLLPETYLFPRGTTRDELVADMRGAHDELMAELWPKRATDLPFDTEEEAVTLASIVEKETGLAEERPRIAAVFINRLKRGMMLQSDPTVIYGLTGGEPLGRGLKRSELDRETPYNTYLVAGLPPTPIANPGRASIEAVLNPPDSDELYFVADGTGGHVFATTLAEHQENVRKWRKIEREFNARR